MRGWLICGKNILPIIVPTIVGLSMRGVKGLAFAFGKNVCLFDLMLLLVSVCCLLLNCFFWVPAVSNFLRRLEMSSMIMINLSLPFTRTSATPTLLSFTTFNQYCF